MGEQLFEAMSKSIEKIPDHEMDDFLLNFLRNLIREQYPLYRRAIFGLASEDIEIFLSKEASFEEIIEHPSVSNGVESVRIMTGLMAIIYLT